MKKRILTISLVLALLVGLIVITTTATEQGTLQAGYAAVSISPVNDGEVDLSVGLPMPGYGTATDRLSDGFINDDGDETNGVIDAGHELMATVIAVTGTDGNTVLLISADTATTNQNWTNTARTRIANATGVAYNNIYIHATGSMSTPEISYGYSYSDAEIEAMREDPAKEALYTRLTKAKAYREYVYDQLVSAAEAAMADRSDVVMTKGELDVSNAILAANPEATVAQQRTVYNTQYRTVKTVDGVETTLVSGHDFGPGITSECTELYEPDDTLLLLQFTPTDTTKMPIVLANWNALPNLSSNGYTAYGLDHRYKISSDYIGSFRNTLAVDPTTGTQVYRTAFLAGTSNNVAAYHRSYLNWDPDVTEEYTPTIRPDSISSSLIKRPSILPTKYGQKLAAAAIYALNAEGVMTESASGKVQTMPIYFATDPNLPTQEQIDLVKALRTAAAPEGTSYSSMYHYLYNNWSEKSNYLEQYPALANVKEAFELNGYYERASHTVYSNRTNFATDTAFCEMHAMMIGDEVAFVISPMELYDGYSKTVTLDTISSDGWNDWDKLRETLPGSLFIATNSNGASGVVTSYLSAEYNKESDTYATGSRDFNFSAFSQGAGEDVITTYTNMFASMTASDGDHKYYCECGGTAAGVAGHTCEDVEWLPWSDPKNIPSSGNYYLTCDVTIQRFVSVSRGTLRIDLNGHTFTRKVQPDMVLISGDEVPESDYYTNTRAFSVTGAGRLVITDSSEGASGKFTRDISALSEADKQRIHNYGLLVYMSSTATNEVVLYAGTMDASNQQSGGGACVANLSSSATIKMYGGEMIGGISDHGTALYTAGKAMLLGGKIGGGSMVDTNDENEIADNGGAVYVSRSGVLTLGGNATVNETVYNDGQPNNIALYGKIKVNNGYTGNAGITINDEVVLNGFVIGDRENEVTDATLAGLTFENPPGGDITYSIVTLDVTKVMIAELRTYCECGGTAAGKLEHTCENITWKPWPYTASLPANSVGGNYYLLEDVVLKSQRSISATTIHLDLNGHDITHQVQAATIKPDNRADENTRVLSFTKDVTFTITDTTANEEDRGVITRDLSLIDEAYTSSITNWGLMMLINENTAGNVTFYAGTMDATDMVSGGGSCVANLSANAVFAMYGGTAKGGVIRSSGVIYSSGPVKLYGGLVTEGVGQTTSNAGFGVRIVSLDENRTGKLYLAGDASVTGNFRSNKTTPSNILVSNGYENFTVVGKYTGTAGISLYNKPYEAMKIGISDNADITEANLTVENYADCDILNKDGYLILNTNAAYITTDSGVKYKSLASAIEAYPGGDAVIVLLRNIDENDLAITQQTYLDLHGFDVTNTGFNANGNKLYVLDSLTDDYTVDDGEGNLTGYGKVTGDIAAVAEGVPEEATVTLDGYMKIVENDAVSFHRLNLRIVGIGLRPANVGVYYQSQFGGDEIIKNNIVAYGTALGALEDPTFRDKTYTRLLAETWLVGADKNGNSNNLKNGTLLKDILMPEYTYSIASRNANATVFGLSYVELPDGTRVCGPMIGYSLKDLFVGNNITGVDASWETYDDTTKAGILDMYSTYNNVMKRWNIPNIKAAASAQS